MGIKGLTKLLADNAPKAMREQKFESYFGRKVAIDASMSIYQFLIVVGRQGTEMLTNKAGGITSHLQGMFTRTVRLLESGLKPVYVFDCAPPDLKKEELKKRCSRRKVATENLAQAEEAGNVKDVEEYSKRSVRVRASSDVEELSWRTAEAPGGMHGQGARWRAGTGCTVMEVSKHHNVDCLRLLRLMGVPFVEVFAVASEDMDSLTVGAPVFLCHLMEPSTRKIPVMEFEMGKA